VHLTELDLATMQEHPEFRQDFDNLVGAMQIANGFDEEMEMFANYCLNGGPSPMDVWEASIPTLIVEKAVEAMQSSKPVAIDLSADFYLPGGKMPASLEQFGDNTE
jgi:hypothetical protein